MTNLKQTSLRDFFILPGELNKKSAIKIFRESAGNLNDAIQEFVKEGRVNAGPITEISLPPTVVLHPNPVLIKSQSPGNNLPSSLPGIKLKSEFPIGGIIFWGTLAAGCIIYYSIFLSEKEKIKKHET